jgi:hypothetical protein
MLNWSKTFTLCFALLALSGFAMAQNTATVYVVHGIPGADLGPGFDPALPVDITVNGACALEGFTFGTIAGPLSLPAGSYDIAIKPANTATPCSEANLLTATAPVVAGMNYSIVAHLTAAGAPTVSAFVNDLSRTAGSARVIAHHTAWAPEVDITIARNASTRSPRGSATLTNVPNGAQASPVFQPGNWQLTIAASADNSVVVVDKAPLQFRPFKAYLVYAVGSLTNNTFELLLKELDTARR